MTTSVMTDPPPALTLITLRRSGQDPITVSETIDRLSDVIASMLRDDDAVRRLPSGDLIVMTALDADHAERFVRRLAEALRRLAPNWARDRLGIALALAGADSTVESMTRLAHRSLEEPATAGIPIRTDVADNRDTDVTALIDARLQRPGFDASARPIEDLLTGQRLALQVLPLLRMANGAELPASRFSGIAHREGLAMEIDHRARAAALSALAGATVPPVISFNVSIDTLGSPFAVGRLCRDLGDTGRAPERYAIEVPETAVGHPTVVASVRRLAQAGHQIWLDDFGRRVGSIAALTSLPITGVKLHHRALDQLANRRDEPFGRQAARLIRTIDYVIATGLHSSRRVELAGDLEIHIGQGRAVAAERRLGARG